MCMNPLSLLQKKPEIQTQCQPVPLCWENSINWDLSFLSLQCLAESNPACCSAPSSLCHPGVSGLVRTWFCTRKGALRAEKVRELSSTNKTRPQCLAWIFLWWGQCLAVLQVLPLLLFQFLSSLFPPPWTYMDMSYMSSCIALVFVLFVCFLFPFESVVTLKNWKRICSNQPKIRFSS